MMQLQRFKQQLAFAISGLLVAFSLAPTAPVLAAQDCNGNAVIWCGVTSRPDLVKKINNGNNGNNTDLKAIFGHRGITNADILSKDTVQAMVTRAGQVKITDPASPFNGKVVATNAMSEGRHFMTGSIRDGGLFKRPTAVSFLSDSISGWANLKGGTFHWAVLGPCGNPVFATPVRATQT